jgi:hypothetical protein
MNHDLAHSAKEAGNDAVAPDANQSAHLVVSEQDSNTSPIELYLIGGRGKGPGGSKGEANNNPRTTSFHENFSRTKGLSGGRISFPHLPPGVDGARSRLRRSRRRG